MLSSVILSVSLACHAGLSPASPFGTREKTGAILLRHGPSRPARDDPPPPLRGVGLSAAPASHRSPRLAIRQARERGRPRGAGHRRRPVIRARLPGGRVHRACRGQAGARGFVYRQIREVPAAPLRPTSGRGRRDIIPFPLDRLGQAGGCIALFRSGPKGRTMTHPRRSEPARAAPCAAPVRRPKRASAEAERRHAVPSLSIGARPPADASARPPCGGGRGPISHGPDRAGRRRRRAQRQTVGRGDQPEAVSDPPATTLHVTGCLSCRLRPIPPGRQPEQRQGGTATPRVARPCRVAWPATFCRALFLGDARLPRLTSRSANNRRAMNHLYYGDNLQVLRDHIASESIDLIYLDRAGRR